MVCFYDLNMLFYMLFLFLIHSFVTLAQP